MTWSNKIELRSVAEGQRDVLQEGRKIQKGSAEKHGLTCATLIALERDTKTHPERTSTLVQSKGFKHHIAIYPSRKKHDSLGDVTHILLTVTAAQSSLLSL